MRTWTTLETQEILGRLNSMTKYPSIETFHKLDGRGGLLEEVLHPEILGRNVDITEKVDGTCARIILLPDILAKRLDSMGRKQSFILGSREDLLMARWDVIGNPSIGIAEGLYGIAERIVASGYIALDRAIYVVFGEWYGNRQTNSWKKYSADGVGGFRVFDIMVMPVHEVEDILVRSREDISRWREHGAFNGQPFLPVGETRQLSMSLDLPCVPKIAELKGEEWLHATSIEGMYALASSLAPKTQAALGLSSTENWTGGKPEGIVIRTPDRKSIVKVRFEEYEKTLGKIPRKKEK